MIMSNCQPVLKSERLKIFKNVRSGWALEYQLQILYSLEWEHDYER
jgi:hypothetical protein